MKEKMFNIAFSVFYIALFVLQMVPSSLLIFVDLSSPWFWVSCVLGLAALITQAIKFPCFAVRMWNCASIGAVLSVAIAKSFM